MDILLVVAIGSTAVMVSNTLILSVSGGDEDMMAGGTVLALILSVLTNAAIGFMYLGDYLMN
jgi:hypothetical protein